MICDKLANDAKVDDSLRSEDVTTFRNWMPYAMYCAAVKCSPRFNKVGERDVMAYSMELYNTENTCWFNFVIQAISCILKKGIIFEVITSFCSKKYQDVSDLLLSIVQCRNISEEKLASIIHFVCEDCHLFNVEI